MKIDRTGESPPYMPVPAGRQPDSTSFAAHLAAATSAQPAGPAQQADFSNMSRQELFVWMNDRIKCGDLSLDDSSGFLSMASPASLPGSPVLTTDHERTDFIQLALEGIATARERREQDSEAVFRKAFAIMQKYHSPASRTD